jgi:hypothetical protein
MFFSIEQSAILRKKNEGKPVTDTIKEVSSQWKLMTDQAKQKYHKLAEQDKLRHHKECEELKSKGYFINKDGVKSTDMLPELKHFPKDTVLPKQAMSAFTCFISAGHAQIK